MGILISCLSKQILKYLSNDNNVICDLALQLTIELIIYDFITFSITLLIGSLFNLFFESLIYILFFSLLREYSGGYHATTSYIIKESPIEHINNPLTIEERVSNRKITFIICALYLMIITLGCFIQIYSINEVFTYIFIINALLISIHKNSIYFRRINEI